jgi:hypothetical protein
VLVFEEEFGGQNGGVVGDVRFMHFLVGVTPTEAVEFFAYGSFPKGP